MNRIARSPFLALSVFIAACGGGSGDTSGNTDSAGGSGGTTSSATGGTGGSTTSSTETGGTGGSTTSSTGGSGVAGLTETVAGDICAALFRCCDQASMNDYFGPYTQSTLLAGFVSKVPPAHTFADEAECAATVKEMIDITPFGDWVAAAEAQQVGFDQAAFEACRSALQTGACGKEIGLALTDGTCFGFAAPPGGELQRKSFHRTRTEGDECHPIRDGVGAAFFGTCDPTGFFCCYEDAASPGDCALPFEGSGAPRTGKCKVASEVGEPCAFFGSVQVCVTGTSCDNSDHCAADGSVPLQVGDPCVDASFNLLGICQGSYCDLLGSGKCEPLKADGADCLGGDECQSTACVAAHCGPPTFCKGP